MLGLGSEFRGKRGAEVGYSQEQIPNGRSANALFNEDYVAASRHINP